MNEKGLALLLLLMYTSINGTLCCYCNKFHHFEGDFGQSVNTSVPGIVRLRAGAYHIDNCYEIDTQWEIVRADGITVVYDLQPEYFRDYTYSNESYHPEKAISISARCVTSWPYHCEMEMVLFLTDMRYNGAQITSSMRLPECYTYYNSTDPVTIDIIGNITLEAPANVTVEILREEEKVNMSWSPPIILDQLPILYYTVYIVSQGIAEKMNTTVTHIILDRPCLTTSYQITAWNEVGQGTPATYEVNNLEPIEKDVLRSGQICLSCSFINNHMLDLCGPPSDRGCLVRLETEATTYSVNFTRQNDGYLVLFDCYTIREQTNFSVTVYETESCMVVEHNSVELANVSLSIEDQIDLSPTVVSLIHSEIEAVDGGVCVSCVFSTNSTAEGCSVTLYNDQYTFTFNVSRSYTEDIALLKCFKVSQSGLYHVTVQEVKVGESKPFILTDVIIQSECISQTVQPGVADEGTESFKLPDVTELHNENTLSCTQNGNSTISIGLAVALGTAILLVIVMMVHCLCARIKLNSKNTVNSESVRGPQDATTDYYDQIIDNVSQQKPSIGTEAPAVYDDVRLPQSDTPAANREEDTILYELIEMKPNTGQEEIKVAPNASYTTVQRQM